MLSTRSAPRRPLSFVVIALQGVLALQLVVWTIDDVNSVTEGYTGFSYFIVIPITLLGLATAAWWRGQSRPLVIVDAIWAVWMLARVAPFDFGQFETYEGDTDWIAMSPLLAAAAAGLGAILAWVGRPTVQNPASG